MELGCAAEYIFSLAAAMIGCASSIRTMPEIPGPPWVETSPKVVIPATWPRELNSGPPGFPWLILISEMIACASTLLTIPVVITFRWCKGLPIVKTFSPSTTGGSSSLCLAKGAGFASLKALISAQSTATSR